MALCAEDPAVPGYKWLFWQETRGTMSRQPSVTSTFQSAGASRSPLLVCLGSSTDQTNWSRRYLRTPRHNCLQTRERNFPQSNVILEGICQRELSDHLTCSSTKSLFSYFILQNICPSPCQMSTECFWNVKQVKYRHIRELFPIFPIIFSYAAIIVDGPLGSTSRSAGLVGWFGVCNLLSSTSASHTPRHNTSQESQIVNNCKNFSPAQLNISCKNINNLIAKKQTLPIFFIARSHQRYKLIGTIVIVLLSTIEVVFSKLGSGHWDRLGAQLVNEETMKGRAGSECHDWTSQTWHTSPWLSV